MENFYAVSAFGDDPTTVISDCIKQLEECPKEANFGFIYVSDNLAESLESILQKCKFKTGINHWAGSLGVALIAPNREIYDQPAISILLCEFPEKEFKVIETIKNADELNTKLSLPENSESYFALMHVDAYNPESQNLLDKLDSSVNNCFISGGITSSHEAQLHIANEVSFDGISGVIFSDKIQIHTNLSQGCSPLGEKHMVTLSQDNIVIELDKKPALDVFYSDIGEMLSRDIKSASQFVFAGLCIPHSDKSDYKIETSLVSMKRKKSSP